MPSKNPSTERFGGPGSSHEDRSKPDKPRRRNDPPGDDKSERLSRVSGGGGERDSHHTHDPRRKGGK